MLQQLAVVLLLSFFRISDQNPTARRIGHLANTQDERDFNVVFEMALGDLRRANITSSAEFSFELLGRYACNEPSVAVASSELIKQNVSIFIGPKCEDGIATVSQYAAWVWDVPVLTYGQHNLRYSDKTIYKTLIHLSPTIQEFARATGRLLQFFNWTRVGFVWNSSNRLSRSVEHTLRPILDANGVAGNILLDLRNGTPSQQQMEEVKNSTRIIIVCLGGSLADANEFLMAAHDEEMENASFAYILLDVNADSARPWSGQSSERSAKILAIYNCVLVISPYGFFGDFIASFIDRPELHQQLSGYDHLEGKFDLLYFYDSIQLYLRSIAACNEKPNCNFNSGSELVAQMRALKFKGMTGPIIFRPNDDRVQPFTIAGLSSETNGPPSLTPHWLFDIQFDTTGYHEYIREITAKSWPTVDGEPPADEPECGFDLTKCAESENKFIGPTMLVSGVIFGAIVFCVVSVIAYRFNKYRLEGEILAMSWKIPRSELIMATARAASLRNFSAVSATNDAGGFGAGGMAKVMIPEQATALDLENERLARRSGAFCKLAAYKGVQVALKRCLCYDELPLQRNRRTLMQFKDLKDAVHENLNSFVGICFNSKHVFTIAWNYCQKGSLDDIIFNDEIKLDMTFQSSILKDILRGLHYLHHSPIGVHGRLTLTNCLVDSRWVVKLSDFGLHQILGEHIQTKTLLWKPESLLSYVHMAPELATAGPSETVAPTTATDIFSFGIIMHYVLYRDSPYETDIVGIEEMLKELRMKDSIIKPMIASERRKEQHADVVGIMVGCWEREPHMRPRFNRVRNTINATMAAFSNNLVDHMVGMMERYAKNLEQMVQSRTEQLNEERKRADNLLNRMLPKSVTERMKLGLTVDAESFDSVTIFFSDIVGFTGLCGQSTPFQIVVMLNRLYSMLDEIIENADAYKVETIGDAYLVVSGLPIRNGKRHVVEVADMTIKIMEALTEHRIDHLPKMKVKMRIGIHTGTVAAGVVGVAMPHYCLFGDAVNISSRMEQTSQPMRIQMSDSSYKALVSVAPGRYEILPRGSIEVKGKGNLETFWLNGRTGSRDSAKTAKTTYRYSSR